MTLSAYRKTIENMFGQLRFLDLRESRKAAAERIRYKNHEILVQRRKYQRSMNLLMGAGGRLKVTAGKSVPRQVIERFVAGHHGWIDQNLAYFEKLRQRYPEKKYAENEDFLLLGQTVRLHFEPALFTRMHVDQLAQRLVVYVPEMCTTEQVLTRARVAVRKFYEKTGREMLDRLVQEWSRKMQLFPSQVSMRSLKSRWGSCSSAGRISLNWRLSVFAEEVAAYVVIHELAHLRHHNHSRAFWQLVEWHCPNYEEYRRFLRDHHYEVDFLAERPELAAN